MNSEQIADSALVRFFVGLVFFGFLGWVIGVYITGLGDPMDWDAFQRALHAITTFVLACLGSVSGDDI